MTNEVLETFNEVRKSLSKIIDQHPHQCECRFCESGEKITIQNMINDLDCIMDNIEEIKK